MSILLDTIKDMPVVTVEQIVNFRKLVIQGFTLLESSIEELQKENKLLEEKLSEDKTKTN